MSRAASMPSMWWPGGIRMSVSTASRREPPHRVEQLGRVAGGGDHVDLARVLEQPAQALAHEVVVLGDDDPQRPDSSNAVRLALDGDGAGSIHGEVDEHRGARRLVPPTRVTVPRSAATRSRMFASPPLAPTPASSVPMPHPSSVIAMRRCPLLAGEPDRRVGRVRVLRGVRERLAHDVVGRRLDVVGEPFGAHRCVRVDRRAGSGIARRPTRRRRRARCRSAPAGGCRGRARAGR